jgi:uncharacterized protein (TIGR02611 family)
VSDETDVDVRDRQDTDDIPGPNWAWRRRLREHRTGYTVYRVVVFLVGLVLVLGGFALVPLPGPGWLIVIIGIAVWATEFERAEALLDFVKRKVRAWEHWVREQPRWVQGAIALATFVFVAAVLWVVFRLLGLPGFLPDGVTTWLETRLGL